MYSWTVLRLQCIDEESSLKDAEAGVSRYTDNSCPSNADEWCSDADDWDVDDEHDSSVCCINEVPASDSQTSVDSLTCDKQIGSSATNVGHNDASSSLPDATSATASKPNNTSSNDEPVQLLRQLTINNEVDKPVCTDDTCTNVQKQSVSVVKVELSNTSFESTSNAAAELEQFYIYVMDEACTADHSDHVEDLLARYTQQEGDNFEAQLESRHCKYVTVTSDQFFFFSLLL